MHPSLALPPADRQQARRPKPDHPSLTATPSGPRSWPLPALSRAPSQGRPSSAGRLHMMSRGQAASGLDGAVRIPHGDRGVDGRGRRLHLDVVVPEEAQQAQSVAKALHGEQQRVSCLWQHCTVCRTRQPSLRRTSRGRGLLVSTAWRGPVSASARRTGPESPGARAPRETSLTGKRVASRASASPRAARDAPAGG
jgi:hypothetical protein